MTQVDLIIPPTARPDARITVRVVISGAPPNTAGFVDVLLSRPKPRMLLVSIPVDISSTGRGTALGEVTLPATGPALPEIRPLVALLRIDDVILGMDAENVVLQ